MFRMLRLYKTLYPNKLERKIVKKLLSTALAAVMATGSIVSANAAVVQENKSVQVLDSGVKLENNTLNVFTYNLSKNSLGGVSFTAKIQKNNMLYNTRIV